MRKLFLTMLLLSLIAPFTVQSQDKKAVQEVYAKTNNDAVDVVWSWNNIVHESMTVDFETGDFSQADFLIDQTFPWEITESAYEGKYAIKSTCEGQNNGVSSIEVTVDVPFDAMMSFYHKVECEYYFDNAYFYIDGVERDLITGNVDWTYREYKVEKGRHTYKWTYRKDSDDFEATADVYFVDNIVLYEKLEPFAGGWIHYDDGHFVEEVGSQSFNVDWGICFPNTEEYAGYNLTKVATYDAESPVTVKANIYYGGTDAPQTLVHSQEFKLKGSGKMAEFDLNAPIPVPENESLWITFHNECSESAYAYPATGCNYTGDPNSDWVSWDKGANWEHLASSGVITLTWMVRGYLENAAGERVVMSKNRNAQEYKVYRRNNITGEETLLAENVTDTTYTDAAWSSTSFGSFQYGVAATYADGDAETVWSNVLAKDMYTSLNVNVATSSNDVPVGARVKFVNVSEQGFDYKVTLDETATVKFDRFRKGNYIVTATLEGYEQYKKELEIVGGEDLNIVLNEIKAAVENLYVSPTGWASWEDRSFDNGGGTFYFDFEKGTMDGWRTVDADNDGLTWRVTTDIMGPGNGYNKSKYCVISQSYCVDSLTPESAALRPDNYLITTEKYLITESSELSYYVCAQDQDAPAEHYAVMISTTEEINDFVTVWEETLSRGTSATRGGRAQTAWYKRAIDLSKYAGQEIYVAFRHFNTVGQFYIDVDNIALVNNAKSARASRSLNGYIVKLNDEIVADNVTTKYYQFEELTPGETYKATVVANYTTGESEAAEYTWTYVSPDNYPGVKSVDGRSVAGKAFIEWTLEGDEEAEAAENSFLFNFSDGTLNGWRNIDADDDGWVWYNSAEMLGPGYGYKDNYCAMSHSFCSYATETGNQFNFPLTPDNYLVTEKKYAITETSQLSFLVCALDPEYCAEHYGVAITMADNATAEDFITIFEETIENDKLDEWDGITPQTEWVLRTIDLSKYAGEEVYIAIRHFNCTDQYIINVDDIALTTSAKSRNENEVLGVMVYCEDELLTPEPIAKRSFYTEFPGYDEYTYCVRVVYSDYGMSAPQCVLVDAPMQCKAPRNLYGEITVNENGEKGVSLVWPFEFSEWLGYDNGMPSSGFHNNGSSFYWGIMLPNDILADYAGTGLTKVKTYDYEAGTATVLIYSGSKNAPMVQKHLQSITYTGSKEWVEFELDKVVPITGEENIWVLVYQSGTAILCEDSGNASNGRWVSFSGGDWMDLKSLNSAYKYVWALKAFVTSEAGEERAVETEQIAMPVNENAKCEFTVSPLEESVVANATNESTLQHYNVYRGHDLNEMEVVETTTEGKFFDVISSGVYYYQVRAVYKDGEETCESEPANSFKNPNQYYIKIEMLSIGETNVNGMMVYPNPAKDNLTIQAEGMTRITITNALGQVVYDMNANSDNEVIDMNKYDAGIYMVRITTETGSVVRKVSKL